MDGGDRWWVGGGGYWTIHSEWRRRMVGGWMDDGQMDSGWKGLMVGGWVHACNIQAGETG